MKLHPLYLSVALVLNGAAIVHAAPLPPKDERLTLSAFFKPISHNKTRFGVNSLHYIFSGATADTINTIRLCNATDATCGTCNTAFTLITAGTSIPYSTGGTTYGVSAASVAAYLAGQSMGNGSYNIGMYVQSSTANCSGSYCSTNTGSNAHLLCMQATYSGGTVTALAQSDNGNAVLNTPAALPGIYAETNNSLATYSPDNGTTWGYMLSPQGGWYWDNSTWATAATTDGTMYQATGVTGNSTVGNGIEALIYSSNGVTWNPVNSFPTDDDWVQSLFAIGSTVYVGTGNGYVYYTSNQGTSWLPVTPAQVPDAGTVNAIVVDTSGHFYAGTSGGNIYYSSNAGQSWTVLAHLPTGGGSISSLAIDNSGTLYTVTSNTTTQPQYNTAPLTSTWQLMSALPGGDGNATTIAASGATVYVGTNTSYVLRTSNLGASWDGGLLSSGDTSGITALFAGQTAAQSPLFVESYGTIQITSSAGTGTVTVNNLSNTTATNVQADASELPTDVTQTSSPCASVAPGGSCSITFSASGTNAFAPTTFNIINASGATIARSALVSSITPNGGTNYYYVYNVNGTTSAQVLDNSDASTGIIWSSNNAGAYDGGIAIYGISEASTTSSPDPSGGAVTGQAACNGATDGSCDANNIYIYYQNFATGHPIPTADYAEGLCHQSTNGSASSGAWYLPSACELNGGIYLNVTTNQFESCSPALTSIFSLYSLGTLGGSLGSLSTALSTTGYYWSSTEYSGSPQNGAWYEYFASSGGGFQYRNYKSNTLGVRCSRALSL